jgi:hypothetical protein
MRLWNWLRREEERKNDSKKNLTTNRKTPRVLENDPRNAKVVAELLVA